MVPRMPYKLDDELKSYLSRAEQEMMPAMRFRSGNLTDFIDLPRSSELEKAIYPGLVILSAQVDGPVKEEVFSLAGAIWFINLALKIHEKVDGTSAYQILAGDYLYTQYTAYLCRVGYYSLLQPLARVICHANEAALLRIQEGDRFSPQKRSELLAMSTGKLAEAACLAGVTAAQVQEPVKEELLKLGLDLGVLWGAVNYDRRAAVEPFIDDAWQRIPRLPQGKASSMLEQILSALVGLHRERLSIV